MKLRIIIILLAALVNNSFAQIKNTGTLSGSSSQQKTSSSFTTVSEAKNIIAEIIAVIGLKQNFEVMVGEVDNAAAVISNSKRYILYNPDFINRLNAAAGNRWASVSILAHETGHHLNGHTLEYIGSQPDKELEADEFSGFVLRRMGATLKEAQAAMKIAADYKKSLTHPGKEDRLIAIALGWNTADKQQGGKDLAKVNLPKTQNDIYKRNQVQTKKDDDEKIYVRTNSRIQNDDVQTGRTRQTTRQSNDGNYGRENNGGATSSDNSNNRSSSNNILADITFTAEQQSSFYLTAQFNIVKQLNSRLYSIGKLTATNDTDYPYIITDDSGTKLWVENSGYIVNAGNRKIGFLKVRK